MQFSILIGRFYPLKLPGFGFATVCGYDCMRSFSTLLCQLLAGNQNNNNDRLFTSFLLAILMTYGRKVRLNPQFGGPVPRGEAREGEKPNARVCHMPQSILVHNERERHTGREQTQDVFIPGSSMCALSCINSKLF